MGHGSGSKYAWTGGWAIRANRRRQSVAKPDSPIIYERKIQALRHEQEQKEPGRHQMPMSTERSSTRRRSGSILHQTRPHRCTRQTDRTELPSMDFRPSWWRTWLVGIFICFLSSGTKHRENVAPSFCVLWCSKVAIRLVLDITRKKRQQRFNLADRDFVPLLPRLSKFYLDEVLMAQNPSNIYLVKISIYFSQTQSGRSWPEFWRFFMRRAVLNASLSNWTPPPKTSQGPDILHKKATGRQ